MPVAMHLPAKKASILGFPKPDAKLTNPFYQATELDKAGDHTKAEKIYQQLLDADFNNCAVMAALGMNYASREKNGIAALLLSTSLSNLDNLLSDFAKLGIIPKVDNPSDVASFVKTKRSEIQNALGTCYKHENKTKEALKWFELAQKGIPLNADIQNNIGTIYINEGKPALAVKYMDIALKVTPDHAQAHWNKALALLELGDYENGWKEYPWGFTAKVRNERNFDNRSLPTWDGSPNARIVVYGEQGIGDEILFASCLNELIAKSELVVFECHKKLHALFCNSFPTIDIYPTREDEIINWPIKPDGTSRYNFTHKLAIGDLPGFFRPSLDTFPAIPYITATTPNSVKWAERLNKLPRRPNIGIAWIGGHKKTRIEVRSTQLEDLLPILKQDANFISLQYTQCEDEIAAFEAKHGIKIFHSPEACYSENYDDKAGLVNNLDLVITVCTSVVHLAGAMGIPTWVMTPSRPAWRYRLDLDYMPWYGETVLYRQSPDTTLWKPVIEEVASNLQILLESVKAPA